MEEDGTSVCQTGLHSWPCQEPQAQCPAQRGAYTQVHRSSFPMIGGPLRLVPAPAALASCPVGKASRCLVLPPHATNCTRVSSICDVLHLIFTS